MSISSNSLAASASTRVHTFENDLRAWIDRGLVRYDGWYLVFVAVVLALGATLLAGMAVWCVVKQGKRFSGQWSFQDNGLKVNMECV